MLVIRVSEAERGYFIKDVFKYILKHHAENSKNQHLQKHFGSPSRVGVCKKARCGILVHLKYFVVTGAAVWLITDRIEHLYPTVWISDLLWLFAFCAGLRWTCGSFLQRIKLARWQINKKPN